MKDHGISLKPGVEYRWHAALVVDSNQRSKDILASGTIKRIVPSEATRDKLARAKGTAAVAAYADEGIWYDSISSLMSLINANPSDEGLRRWYASLLGQVGLGQVVGKR